ncbi:hypothetical protein BX600DRAFT_212734 [Xylariales sp. PMI_506]|nr:hypothetical protein BX600DRAFT_212734 [Xylariales sp. PMI_506]
MRTFSLVQVAISGLLATSAANAFELGSSYGVSRRHVGAVLALAVPVFGAPIVDVREPHHNGQTTGGKKAGVAAACAGVKRDPHHNGQTTGGNGNNAAAAAACAAAEAAAAAGAKREEIELAERDEIELAERDEIELAERDEIELAERDEIELAERDEIELAERAPHVSSTR